jgi:glycosyltransferase involved in cell wall biosynthesis
MPRLTSVALVEASAATPDGVGGYTEQLAEHLARRSDLDIERVDVRRQGAWGLIGAFRRRDVVHVQFPLATWRSPLPLLLPPILSRLQARLVVTIHEWQELRPSRRLLAASLVAAARGLIFVSRGQARSFPRHNDALATTIPIGLNLAVPAVEASEVARARARLGPADVLLGYFGFLYPSKQPERMLDVLHRLRAGGCQARLVIAGMFQPHQARLQASFDARVRSLGLERAVVRLGYVDERSLATTLAACDALLLLFRDGVSARRSSFWYGLRLGVPLLTTEPQDPTELDGLLDLEAATAEGRLRLVGPGEGPDMIARSLLELVARRGARSRGPVGPSWDAIAEQHAAFYRAVA